MPREREENTAEAVLRLLQRQEQHESRIRRQRAILEQAIELRAWHTEPQALRWNGNTSRRRIVGRTSRNSNPNRKIMLEKSKKEGDV